MTVPSNVVTVTPAKPVNNVSILKSSSLGILSTPSNDSSLKAETSVSAQTSLPPVNFHLYLVYRSLLCSKFLLLTFVIIFSISDSSRKCEKMQKLPFNVNKTGM